MIKLNKAVLASFIILCLLPISSLIDYKSSVKASPTTWTVDDDRMDHSEAHFTAIQEAINNAADGDTIFVYKGTYCENVVVNKSVSLVGEDIDLTIVDGNGTGSVISINADNVSIERFTMKRSGTRSYDSGIFVDRSDGNDLSHNTIVDNNYGISLYYSGDNLISDNTITENNDGVSLYSSIGNLISDNKITDNSNGIFLYYSASNVVSRNTITENDYGIVLFDSSSNSVFHNNFVGNAQQTDSYSSINVWHNGNEGNYWSDYTGVDLYGGPYQNETGWDGIGDRAYKKIEGNNIDNHPLMGIFSAFKVTLERKTYNVTTTCNSTISEFRFEIGPDTGNKIIRFNATGKDGTVGFCRLTIPTELMNYPFIVLVDDEEIVQIRLESVSDDTYVYLYFAYTHSSHTITIISSRARKLEINLNKLNETYHILMNNYEILLANYSQLQESYRKLNNSYQEHLSGYSQNVHNIRNLMYIFAATTAILITATIYLSKHAHTDKTKVFEAA